MGKFYKLFKCTFLCHQRDPVLGLTGHDYSVQNVNVPSIPMPAVTLRELLTSAGESSPYGLWLHNWLAAKASVFFGTTNEDSAGEMWKETPSAFFAPEAGLCCWGAELWLKAKGLKLETKEKKEKYKFSDTTQVLLTCVALALCLWTKQILNL